jgi:hypothetical protein
MGGEGGEEEAVRGGQEYFHAGNIGYTAASGGHLTRTHFNDVTVEPAVQRTGDPSGSHAQ